jgi:uncharacterized repeat protein (TIGR01451 family)
MNDHLPRLVFAGLCALILVSPGASAQEPPPVERLQASDRAAGDLFGCALDLQVDPRRAVLLVGSLHDDDLGPDSGSAYVFELAPGADGWAETAKLRAPDGAAGDRLGFAVALAEGGDDALLGAPFAGAGGAVYRVRRGPTGGWEPVARLATDEAGAALGSSLAFAAGLVAAGAPTATSDGRREAGAVFLFDPAGGLVRRLAATGAAAGDAFGWSLAWGGGTLAVGAPWADGRFTDTGAVHLFAGAGGAGVRLVAPDAAPFDAFGYAVAADGDLLAVGAPRADGGAGAVYVFRRGAGGFALEARIGGTVPGAQLGTAVALAGELLAAGARREGGAGQATGAVRLFRRGGGAWAESERFQPPPVRGGDELGIDVALSAAGLAAGAYRDDAGGTDAGSVYVRVPPRAEPDPEPQPFAADLSFAIAAGTGLAVPGEPFSYAIEICNLGPADAPDQTFGGGGFGPSFLDPTWSCTGTGGGACAPTAGSGPIAGILTLPAGGCVVYDLDVRVAPCVRGSLVLAGGLGTPPFDPDPSNNADSATTPLAPRADLAVAVAADPAVYRAGETASLTVTVTNGGPSCATDAAVRAFLPPALVPGSWTCEPGPGASCAGGSGLLDDLADLPPGTAVVYTVAATVAPGFLGPQTVSAAVDAEPGLDLVPENDRAEAALVLLPPAGEVAATKSVVGSFLPGSVAVYEIVLANGSEVDLPNGSGFELIDPLPPEVTLLSAEASRGEIVPDPDAAAVLWDGDLPAGELVVLTIRTRILAVAHGSPVSNQATFRFVTGPDPEDEVEGATAPPGAEQEAPTTFTVRASIDIPAASTWGLAALALLLAAAAAARLRHRSVP